MTKLAMKLTYRNEHESSIEEIRKSPPIIFFDNFLNYYNETVFEDLEKFKHLEHVSNFLNVIKEYKDFVDRLKEEYKNFELVFDYYRKNCLRMMKSNQDFIDLHINTKIKNPWFLFA